MSLFIIIIILTTLQFSTYCLDFCCNEAYNTCLFSFYAPPFRGCLIRCRRTMLHPHHFLFWIRWTPTGIQERSQISKTVAKQTYNTTVLALNHLNPSSIALVRSSCLLYCCCVLFNAPLLYVRRTYVLNWRSKSLICCAIFDSNRIESNQIGSLQQYCYTIAIHYNDPIRFDLIQFKSTF